MNRRRFLISLSVFPIAVFSYKYFSRREQYIFNNDKLKKLSNSLSPYQDNTFKNALRKLSPIEKFDILVNNQILDTSGSINFDSLEHASKTDRILIHNNKYYSESELILYSFSYGYSTRKFNIDHHILNFLDM